MNPDGPSLNAHERAVLAAQSEVLSAITRLTVACFELHFVEAYRAGVRPGIAACQLAAAEDVEKILSSAAAELLKAARR